MARHALIFPLERLLPVASAIGLLLAALANRPALRVLYAVPALFFLGAWLVKRRARGAVIVDDAGYTLERIGRPAVRVPFSAIKKVLVDESEQALFCDTQDPARNLLVPPRYGYGFHFADSATLYAAIVAAVADRIELVDSLKGVPR